VSIFRETLPPTPPAIYTRRRCWLGTKSYWACQLGAWTLIIAVQMFCFIIDCQNKTPLLDEFVSICFLAFMTIVVTHLLRVVYLFCRKRRYGWSRMLAVALGASIYHAMGMGGMLGISITLNYPEIVKNGDIASSTGIPEYLSFCVSMTLLVLCWTAFYFGILIFRQYQVNAVQMLQMDSALKEAQMRTLKAQINPHFLFNSLNTVRALIPHELSAPREAVTRLADFLRSSLNNEHKKTVSFAEELEVVQDFLAIEKLRHEDRLRVEFSIDPFSLDWPIPPFLFQTIVENAVKYGVAPLEKGGLIRIEAQVCKDQLNLCVSNPGRINQDRASTGLGLSNARARLDLLFGQSASLRLEQAGENLVHTCISIPHNLAESGPEPA